ncbi:MAG: hypothetical protein E6538_08475 [Paeniclostridium sordellii]|nr:hypothetical protein [Paeniclostridium sordellii]
MKKKLLNTIKYYFLIHIINFITSLLPGCELTNKIRGRLMKSFFKKCRNNLQIASNV